MPKLVDHDAYRNEIVVRATELFAQHGYAALGLREIAQQLGISKSALYHYFPGKEQLFAAVCQAVAAHDADELRALATSVAAAPERLAALTTFVREREPWFVQQYLVLSEARRLQMTLPAAATDAEPYVTALAEFLVLTPDQAQAVLYFLNGLIIQRWLDGGRTDLDRAMRQIGRWFVGEQEPRV